MPAHWPPWPEKTKARRARVRLGVLSASAASSLARVGRSAAKIAARDSKWVRVVAREKARSGRARSPLARMNSRRRVAWARRATSDRPEMRMGSSPASMGSDSTVSGTAGACSRMRWALVPLMPKEETPARRGWPLRWPRFGSREQLDRARGPVDMRRTVRRRAGSAAAGRCAARAPS